MSEEEKDAGEQSQGFRVTDRRRFSPESGEPRPDETEPASVDTADQARQPTAEDQHPGTVSGASRSEQIEITFSSFVLGLSTQALMYLGEVPAAPDQATRTDVRAAQQMIDVLAMLQKKTSGNLDVGEAQMLEDVLYDLRMRYVKLQREACPA